jgi:NADH/NAD ratio-sensing transcriptional regulator Rex
MKNVFLFAITVGLLTNCGGSMSDEQRKQMLDAREQQKIQKISEAEIMDLAFAKGRDVMGELPVQETSHVDSIGQTHGVKIHWLVPGTVNGLAIEQQLIEAYINSVIEGTPLQDNVQKVGTDSLVYTRAVVIARPDSSVEVKGTWNIWMSKKQLILGMGKK